MSELFSDDEAREAHARITGDLGGGDPDDSTPEPPAEVDESRLKEVERRLFSSTPSAPPPVNGGRLARIHDRLFGTPRAARLARRENDEGRRG